MIGQLPIERQAFKAIPWANIAIIAAMWHSQYSEQMITATKGILIDQLGVQPSAIQTHWLPGSYELPYAAQLLFEQQSQLDAIIAFGIVLKGQTTHDDSVIQSVVSGFSQVSLQYQKPIINEVIGVTDLNHAKARTEFKGQEAAFAVSELLAWRQQLG